MSYGSLEPDPLLQGVNSVVTYHWTQAWIVALQLPLAHQDPRGAHFAERGTFCMQTQAEVEVRVRIASSERSWSLQICSWPPAAASPGPVGFLFHASDQFWPPPAWASLEAMVVTIFVYKKKYMRTAYREKGETVLGVLMSEGCWACGQPQIFGCWAAPGSGMGTFEMCQSLGKWRSAEAVFAARVRYHPLLQKSEGGAGLGGGSRALLQLSVAFRQVDCILASQQSRPPKRAKYGAPQIGGRGLRPWQWEEPWGGSGGCDKCLSLLGSQSVLKDCLCGLIVPNTWGSSCKMAGDWGGVPTQDGALLDRQKFPKMDAE